MERIFGTRKQRTSLCYPAASPLLLAVVTCLILRLPPRWRAQAVSGVIVDTIFVNSAQIETAWYAPRTRIRLRGRM